MSNDHRNADRQGAWISVVTACQMIIYIAKRESERVNGKNTNAKFQNKKKHLNIIIRILKKNNKNKIIVQL